MILRVRYIKATTVLAAGILVYALAAHTVYAYRAPSIGYFTASPTNVLEGQAVTLSFQSVAGSKAASQGISPIDAGHYTVPGSYTLTVYPSNTTTYDFSIADGTSNPHAYATVTVTKCALSVSPTSVTTGGNVTLSWSSSGAASASIDHSVGSVSVNNSNSMTVNPTVSTTYTGTFTGPGGTTCTAAATVSVNDSSAPTVSITAPTNGGSVSGTSATLSATASDNIGVAGVLFTVDGSAAAAEDTSSPYSVTWNSNSVTNGSHTFAAVARDAGGNTTISSVTATVQNYVAATGTAITGYGWSASSGWISFNCSDSNTCASSNYGVYFDASGNLSGYAWSDNLGWISASASDLGGCPQAPCTATIQNGVLTGWLKALSGGSDGWGGWIQLSGVGQDGYTYSPMLSGGTFSGFAWGGSIIGWVDFSRVHTPFVSDLCPNIDGTQSTMPQGYGLVNGECVSCIVCNPATPTILYNSCTGVQTTCADGKMCSVSSVTCVDASSASKVDFTDANGFLHTHAIEAHPSLIAQGLPTKLFWKIKDAKAHTCSVSGSYLTTVTGPSSDGYFYSGDTGVQTSGVQSRTVYTLTCTGLDNSPFIATTTVDIIPLYREK